MTEATLFDQVKKLSPQSGDVLVVKLGQWARPEEAAHAQQLIHDWLSEHSLKIPVLITAGEVQVDVLDEKQMAELGWIRKSEKRGYEFL